jgi:hypothetical protein
MKRLLTSLASVAVLAIPTSAATASSEEITQARGGQDLQIEFILRSVNGKPTQIRDFTFRNFTVECNQGGPVDVRGRLDRMSVNDAGRFDGNIRKDGGKVHIEGDVKNGGAKVVGILKARGKFLPATGCDDKVAWEAS